MSSVAVIPRRRGARSGKVRSACLLVGGLVALTAPAVGWAQESEVSEIRDEIRERVRELRARGAVDLAGERVVVPVLVELYEGAEFAPLWSPASLARWIDALDLLRVHGLHPASYHLAGLQTLSRRRADPSVRAERDLLATASFARALEDLRVGTVRGVAERGSPAPPPPDAGELRGAILAGDFTGALDAAAPDHPVYRGLVAALEDLRRVAGAGGFEPIPPGPSMRRDSADIRAPLLRKRLGASGDLNPGAAENPNPVFDVALEAAVRSFQHRHGLNEDGIVGRATLEALNVPVETRIEQVRANLERARWVFRDLPADFVVVNIAGARAYLVRAGEVAFETRVIVGQTHTRTPVFRADLLQVDLNPTWTVPPGIVAEVLARVRRDPGYLSRDGMRVLDARGRPVPPSSIDFDRYSGQDFPWVFRQDPGPTNPLGRVKLVLPNPFHVYLHDTPARHLFAAERRTFSHGCIRVEDPLRLAELVLDDPAWTRSSLEEAIATGRTRTLPLDRALPVLVLYWTAAVDLHGELHFYRDVYGRDPGLLRALDGG